ENEAADAAETIDSNFDSHVVGSVVVLDAVVIKRVRRTRKALGKGFAPGESKGFGGAAIATSCARLADEALGQEPRISLTGRTRKAPAKTRSGHVSPRSTPAKKSRVRRSPTTRSRARAQKDPWSRAALRRGGRAAETVHGRPPAARRGRPICRRLL